MNEAVCTCAVALKLNDVVRACEVHADGVSVGFYEPDHPAYLEFLRRREVDA